EIFNSDLNVPDIGDPMQRKRNLHGNLMVEPLVIPAGVADAGVCTRQCQMTMQHRLVSAHRHADVGRQFEPVELLHRNRVVRKLHALVNIEPQSGSLLGQRPSSFRVMTHYPVYGPSAAVMTGKRTAASVIP